MVAKMTTIVILVGVTVIVLALVAPSMAQLWMVVNLALMTVSILLVISTNGQANAYVTFKMLLYSWLY